MKHCDRNRCGLSRPKDVAEAASFDSELVVVDKRGSGVELATGNFGDGIDEAAAAAAAEEVELFVTPRGCTE